VVQEERVEVIGDVIGRMVTLWNAMLVEGEGFRWKEEWR
jgi:hypothetical protein